MTSRARRLGSGPRLLGALGGAAAVMAGSWALLGGPWFGAGDDDMDAAPQGGPAPSVTSPVASSTSTDPARYRAEERLAVPGHPGRPTRLAVASDPGAPMLVFFHGQNGSIANVQERSGLVAAAETADMSVLWLSGAAVPTRSWNTNGRCCTPASSEGVDDLAYVEAALDAAYATGVAADTVVAVGVSNGGGMAVTVGCRFPDRFDAAVSVAGWIPVRCTGANISLLTIGGTRDANLGADRARAMASTWRGSVARCGDEVERQRSGNAAISTWSGCSAGSLVRLVELEGVGHVWPRFDYYDATSDIIEFTRRLDAGSAD